MQDVFQILEINQSHARVVQFQKIIKVHESN